MCASTGLPRSSRLQKARFVHPHHHHLHSGRHIDRITSGQWIPAHPSTRSLYASMAPAVLLGSHADTTMAIDVPHQSNGTSLTTSTVTGTASNDRVLVVGSLDAAQSGHYQNAIQEAGLGGVRQVEMHMADRLTSGTVTLDPASYSLVRIIAPWTSDVHSLLTPFANALRADGKLLIEALSDSAANQTIRQIENDLRMMGFTDIQGNEIAATVSATKANASTSSSSSSSAAALPLRRKLANGSTTSSRKKALWNLAPANATLIDQNALLTDAEKAVPAATRREDCDLESALAGGRRKKACKGCTCGLRELEEEEETARMQGIVKLDEQDVAGVEDGPEKTEVTETMVDENGITRVIKRVKIDTKGATSSCGSCFLGDAFRCSSCPYLGESSLAGHHV